MDYPTKVAIREFMNGALPENITVASKLPASLKWIFSDETNDRFFIRLCMAGNWIIEPEDHNEVVAVFTPAVLEWMVMGSKIAKGGK